MTAKLGVVIVLHGSGDVIGDCLTTLLASADVTLDIAIVDNASTDDGPAIARAADPGPHRLQVIETGRNGGYASGVNTGLRILADETALDRFWILNPDTLVPPETAHRFATFGAPFGLLGGRVVYADPPGLIQIDGGIINRWTGVTSNLNRGAPADAPPAQRAADFVTGASLVVSRTFLDEVGPMPEDYFLYYEEVAWASRGQDHAIRHDPQAIVRHRAGTAIGSQTQSRGPSPFSAWFLHRARLRFVRRYRPTALPGALAYSIGKAVQAVLRRQPRVAAAILTGSLGIAPPREVREHLAPGSF
ncbi:MAG: glycosyltransferase family 2 protein [Pseudomonadota bacterium]